MRRVELMIGMLLIAAGAIGSCQRDRDTPRVQNSASPAPSQPVAAPPGNGGASLPDFTWLVNQYGAAVVNVKVVGRAGNAGDMSPSQADDPFSDFFRHFGIPLPGGPAGRAPPLLRGEGSGFIVSAEGHVLTNAHVVAQASTVTVKLPDRREFPARVIGADRLSDIAVLKVEATGLPVVRAGNPSQLQPGQWVVAIGSPFGFENSVTVGVVSATARALGPQSSLVPFIQSDVAVNPGNSGGPLFNLRGEVVGINSQIYSATGGYQGVSFAIPIDVALDVQKQLISTGHVTRGRIGIAIQDVDASLAKAFGLDRPRGALVSAVEPDGPAAKAGLKAGDVILTLDGTPIETSGELPARVASVKPGSDARLRVWRSGKTVDLRVRVAELKDDEGDRTAAGAAGSRGNAPLGLTVRPLTSAERAESQTEGRIVVESVAGPAAEAGIQPGDLILAVGNQNVSSVEELRRAASRPSESVAFLVQRDGQRIYFPVRVPSGSERSTK